MSVADIHKIPDRTFMYLDELRRLCPCEDTYGPFVRKSFPLTGIDITAVEHAFCASLHESGDHFIPETLRPCAGELDNAPTII